MGDPNPRTNGVAQSNGVQNLGFDHRGYLNSGFTGFTNPPNIPSNGNRRVQQQQPSNASLSSSETRSTADPILQQRLFGVLNEAGTNVSHVPAGIQLPGQSFTFQHARFAVSGADLANLLSRQDAAQASALGSVLNQPGINPIYRPDFTTKGSGMQTMSNMSYQSTSATMPMQQAPPQVQISLPQLSSAPPMLPNFSVMAQNLGRSDPYGNQSMMRMPVMPGQGWNGPMGAGQAGVGMSQYGHMGMPVYGQQSVMPQNGQMRGGAVSRTEEDDGRKRKRRKRDPNLPTPARFAWNFYFRDQYTKIRNAEPSEHSNVQKAFTDIGLDLGKKWKSLSKEEKAPYIKMAEQDRERYEREMRERLSGAASSSSSLSRPHSDGDEAVAQHDENASDNSEEEPQRVGIVLHEVEVEDKRDDSEKNTAPTEGELVADVLVVDDDEVFLKIIRHRLIVGQKNPPRVMTVTNTDEAKKLILNEKKKFGTILLDKNFGEGHEDGIASLQCIREHGYSGVIVGVTGSTDEKTREEFAKSGADKTFVKGSTSFYDDLLTLVNVHSTNAELMEKAADNPTTEAPAAESPAVQ